MTTDELIDALIEQTCGVDDIIELARRADDDSTVRNRVASALAAEHMLRDGLDEAERVAARANVAPAPESPARIERAGRRRRSSRRRLGSALASAGMLVGVVLGAAVGARFGSPVDQSDVSEGGPSGADAFRLALTSGQVLEELPPLTVSVEEAGDGQFDVVFVRRWLERARVDEMFRLARDEHGRPVAIQTDAAPQGRRESM